MHKDYLSEVKSVQAIVSEVDQDYRLAAFQAILLHRLLTSEVPSRVGPPEPKKGGVFAKPGGDPVSMFMGDTRLDTPEFSQLFGAPKLLLEKSLAVLKIARDGFSVDGLSAGDVAEILTQKFRVAHVHEPNVRGELRKATAYVSRVSADHGYRYLLMAEGESHLTHTLDQLRGKKS
jgi:hypothetical protein